MMSHYQVMKDTTQGLFQDFAQGGANVSSAKI